MALGLSVQIHVPLNPDMIFFLVSVMFSALSTHLANVTLLGYVSFLLTIVVFFLSESSFERLEASHIQGLKCTKCM
jgi:hypothetical protein